MTLGSSPRPVRRVDLHLHTTASDGWLSPTEVVRKALALGLAAIAITDHDTTQGVAEALEAARGTELEVVSGVELSTDTSRTEVHILGYYVSREDAVLREKLQLLGDSRLRRAQRMMEKLSRMGLPVEWARVQQLASGASVGRPHVARAMVEKGYVSSVAGAFDQYIGKNGPAYVERYKLSPTEAVQLILASQGLPVIAHPLQVNHLIPELARHGLVGLEAYYPGYAPEETRFLLDLAGKHGLVATGGSDFHGDAGQPANEMGSVNVPLDALESLRARRGGARAKVSG